MKVSQNFDIREFVSEETWNKWGERSVQFVSKEIIALAQFYSQFFGIYFRSKNPKISKVKIVINNWSFGGNFQMRGYRPPSAYAKGGHFGKTPLSESQHRRGNAFDCDVILVIEGNREVEVPQAELHQIIKANWLEFKNNGLTTIEALEDAPTWLHSDCRTTNSPNLLIVNA